MLSGTKCGKLTRFSLALVRAPKALEKVPFSVSIVALGIHVIESKQVMQKIMSPPPHEIAPKRKRHT